MIFGGPATAPGLIKSAYLMKLNCAGDPVDTVCVDTTTPAPPFEVLIYPVPSRDAATVEVRGLEIGTALELELFDVAGRLILRSGPLQKGMNDLDLSRIAAGLFPYRILSGSDSIKRGKLLIWK